MRTTFRNYPTGSLAYGYRLWDNYAQSYNNTLTLEDMQLSAEEFLRKILDKHISDEEGEMLEHAQLSAGLELDGEFYDSEEVKKMIKGTKEK